MGKKLGMKKRYHDDNQDQLRLRKTLVHTLPSPEIAFPSILYTRPVQQ
jgi:hypothetical protein